MIIKLLVDGGDMKPGPAIGQKLGPLGINIGKVIEEVNKATSSFKGIKVPVEINLDAKTKNFSVEVASPPVAELLKKEIGVEKGSGQPNRIKVANASIEQIISVAKTKEQDMLSNNFKSAVKSVVGSCISLGILIENKDAKEVLKEINKGEYDNEIKKKITTTSKEKKVELDKFFLQIKTKQDEILRKEQEKKEEEAVKETKTAEKPSEETKKAETKTAEKLEKKK